MLVLHRQTHLELLLMSLQTPHFLDVFHVPAPATYLLLAASFREDGHDRAIFIQSRSLHNSNCRRLSVHNNNNYYYYSCYVAHCLCHILPSIGLTPSWDLRLNASQTLTYQTLSGNRPVLVWDVWPRWHFQPLWHRLRVHCLSRTPSWWTVPVQITVLFRTIWAFGHLLLAVGPSPKIFPKQPFWDRPGVLADRALVESQINSPLQ